MKNFIVFATLVIVTGCASHPKKMSCELPSDLPAALTSQFAPLPQAGALLAPAGVVEARIQKFVEKHAKWTERDKIVYLIEAVRTSPAQFERFGCRYTPDQAAKWLRWKMTSRSFLAAPIRSGQDFVDRVPYSRSTGLPYGVVFPDGSKTTLKEALDRELHRLEDALGRRALNTPFAQGAPVAETAAAATVPPPALLPSGS